MKCVAREGLTKQTASFDIFVSNKIPKRRLLDNAIHSRGTSHKSQRVDSIWASGRE